MLEKGKIASTELLPTAAILLYGSFASEKAVLRAGTLAIPLQAAAALVELAAILAVSALPPVKGKALSFAAALLPLPAAVAAFINSSRDLHASGYGFVPLPLMLAAGAALAAYTAWKGLAALGRLSTVVCLTACAVAAILFAAYCRDLDVTRIACGFSEAKDAVRILLSPLLEVWTLYLMKSAFYVPVPKRPALPPVELALTGKELAARYKKTLVVGWAVSSALSLAVTAFLLSVADSAVFAHSTHAAVFGARMTGSVNISPFVGVCVYAVTLLRCTATLTASAALVSSALRGKAGVF